MTLYPALIKCITWRFDKNKCDVRATSVNVSFCNSLFGTVSDFCRFSEMKQCNKSIKCYSLIKLPTVAQVKPKMCRASPVFPFDDKPLQCRESGSVRPPHISEQGHRFTAWDSYWTIMVSEIPSRCLNKPSNRAIILKQKVTSGVTTGPEINKAPNYDRSTGPIFGHRPPAIQEKIRFQGNLIPPVRL